MSTPDGMDQIDGREVAHGLLVALIVQQHNGAAELDTTVLQDVMGDAEGRLWSVLMEPTGDPTRVRLVVVKLGRDYDGTVR